MFRFLFARRGKGNISLPVKTQRNTQLATENIDMQTSKTFEILRPVILVSAALSGYTHRRYRVLGIVGGFVWLTMLLAHATLDFLAARQVYTYGWASVSLSLFLLCFVCTIFTNKRMLPWLEKGVSKLEDEQKYPKTLERCAKVFKVREWVNWFPVLSDSVDCSYYENVLLLSAKSKKGTFCCHWAPSTPLSYKWRYISPRGELRCYLTFFLLLYLVHTKPLHSLLVRSMHPAILYQAWYSPLK